MRIPPCRLTKIFFANPIPEKRRSIRGTFELEGIISGLGVNDGFESEKIHIWLSPCSDEWFAEHQRRARKSELKERRKEVPRNITKNWKVARDRLSPNGLAFLSYNRYPEGGRYGWNIDCDVNESVFNEIWDSVISSRAKRIYAEFRYFLFTEMGHTDFFSSFYVPPEVAWAKKGERESFQLYPGSQRGELTYLAVNKYESAPLFFEKKEEAVKKIPPLNSEIKDHREEKKSFDKFWSRYGIFILSVLFLILIIK